MKLEYIKDTDLIIIDKPDRIKAGANWITYEKNGESIHVDNVSAATFITCNKKIKLIK